MTDTDHDDEMFNEDADRSSSEKTVYEELAEKEEALLLAAQFGKNLIEEKEELERQIESIKQDHQNELENYEQESFQLKRLIESIKNEYESKIYELNDDITILKKELKESQLSHLIGNTKYGGVLNRDDELELINELKERNSILVNQISSNEIEITTLNQTINLLESKLDDKEKTISDNSKLLNSYQKEISKLMKKQQELEFALMQTYSERDKQTKIMEEVTHKYLLLENDKNELEHLILQRDHEIYSLRQSNKNLLIKLERLESSTSPVVGDKRRSLSTLDSNIKKNASSSSVLSTQATSNQVENTKPVETQSSSRSRAEERKDEKVNETMFNFGIGAATLLQSNPLRFSAGSNLDEDDREDDYDVDDGNYVDFVKSTQIEYDDDDEDDLFSSHHHALNPPASFTPIYTNWQEESSTSENLAEQCVENKADTTTESSSESREQEEESKDAFKHQNGVQLMVSRSCDEDDLISFDEYHQSTNLPKECSL